MRAYYNRQPVARPRLARTGLTDGLVTAIYPLSAFSAVDVVTGAIGYATASAALVGNPAPVIDGNAATAMEINNASTGGGIAFGVQATLADRIAGPYSIFVEGGPAVNANLNTAFASSENSNGHGFNFGFDDSSFEFNSVWSDVDESAGNIRFAYDGSGTELGTNSELYSHRVMTTGSGSAVKFYGKGHEIAAAGTGVGLPTADVLRYTSICSRRANTTGSRARVSLALAWNRVLTLDEYLRLYQNPWQVFAPRRKAVFFDSGAVIPANAPIGMFDPHLNIKAWF